MLPDNMETSHSELDSSQQTNTVTIGNRRMSQKRDSIKRQDAQDKGDGHAGVGGTTTLKTGKDMRIYNMFNMRLRKMMFVQGVVVSLYTVYPKDQCFVAEMNQTKPSLHFFYQLYTVEI